MSIVPTNVPMTSALCEQTAQALTERYPDMHSEVLTTTAYGRPVRLLRMGTGGRKVIFSAAHHANEWITAPLLLKFAEDLAQARQTGGSVYGVPAETICQYTTLYLVPMVDPDGVDLVTGAIAEGSPEYGAARSIAANFPGIPFPSGWKANLQGVDLNLQYPAGWLQAREIKFSQGYTRPAPRDFVGRSPLSQPETQALAALTDDTEPALVLALHTQGRVIYWQFRDYPVPGAEALAREFARVSGYTAEATPYESAFAGYKDWFIQKFRRPGFTIECGQGENPLLPDQFGTIYQEILGILVTAALGLPGGEPPRD